MEVEKFLKEATFGKKAQLPAVELAAMINGYDAAKMRIVQLEKMLEAAVAASNTVCVGITSHGKIDNVEHVSYNEFIAMSNKPVNVTIASIDLINLLRDYETTKTIASQRFTQIKELDKKINALNVRFAEPLEAEKVIEVEGLGGYLKSPYNEPYSKNLNMKG